MVITKFLFSVIQFIYTAYKHVLYSVKNTCNKIYWIYVCNTQSFHNASLFDLSIVAYNMYWEQSLIEQFFSYDKIRSFRVKINKHRNTVLVYYSVNVGAE